MDTTGYKSSNNYIGLNNQHLANKLAERTIDNAVPYLRKVLDSLPPNFTLLDIGCGPASITINIAQDYPQCTILALDEPGALAVAKKNIEAAGGVPNIHLAAGDALDIQAVASSKSGGGFFEAVRGRCDVAHTHQVHMHVQDAPRLMRELRAAVKPKGGIVCCREADMGLMAMYPDMMDQVEASAAARLNALVPRVLTKRGQDPYVGRKLVSHALRAGFRREDVEASVGVWLYSTPEERVSLAQLFDSTLKTPEAAETTGEFMKELGEDFDEADLEKAGKAWDEWVAAEDGWCCLLSGQVVCRRND